MHRTLLIAALFTNLAYSLEPLYLDSPEVVKLDWNTACPRAADLNGDGLLDLIVINQDRARLDILLQRKDGIRPGDPERTSRTDRWNPVLEISRFDKQPLVIGHSAMSLTLGDWNGDGKADLAYVSDGEKLILRTQGKSAGEWGPKKEFLLDSTSTDTESLLSADLNQDGKDDLAVLTKTRLQIWTQTATGWAEPKSYILGQTDSGGLRSADLNGDGKLDLFYTSPDADAVLVRLQQEGFSFAEEWRLETETSRCWAHPVRLSEGSQGLATLEDRTGMVALHRLASGPVQPNADRASSIRYAMPTQDTKGGAVAFGDLNNDPWPDVVLTEAKNARLWFFAGVKGGTFREAREFPALSGIEALSIADIDGDQKNELILLSTSEKNISISRWHKDRLAYPEVIHQGTDTLLTLTTGNIGANAGTNVLALTEAKSKVSLLTLNWQAKEKKFASKSLELPSSPSKPNALRVLDANQDGRGDLALFSTLTPMQILLSNQDEKNPFKRADGLPDSIVNKISPLALTLADLDADSKAEFIIAKDQLARAFRIGPDGKAVTVEQFNAPDSASVISSVLISQKAASEKGAQPTTTVLLVDTAQQKLHEMQPGQDGVYRSAHSHALSSTGAEQMHLLGDRLLALAKTSFDLIPLAGQALRLDTFLSFDSELKDTKPSDLIPAPFSGAKADDIALVDYTVSRVLEFFQPTQTNAPLQWQSALYFRVFETDPHFRGKGGRSNEPHDYITLDLNADGKLDLALLVHDRLLLYLRK